MKFEGEEIKKGIFPFQEGYHPNLFLRCRAGRCHLGCVEVMGLLTAAAATLPSSESQKMIQPETSRNVTKYLREAPWVSDFTYYKV